MKHHLSLCLFFVVTLNGGVYAQVNPSYIVGNYEMRIEATNAIIVDTLTLSNDGTFVFHEYDKHERGIPTERNTYAKGNWKVVEKVIVFYTAQSDFDEKFTLDFDQSKARFINKSPRDKSNREVKTSIQFYESEIQWMKGRTLLKKS